MKDAAEAQIGRGTFSNVVRARDSQSGLMVAVKVHHRLTDFASDLAKTERDIYAFMKEACHPSIK